MLTYRPATAQDADVIAQLGKLLYSQDNELETLRFEAEEHLQSDKWAVFLAFDGETPIGMCEVSLRTDYVEGRESDGFVGYLEGIYVVSDFRKQGVAKTLLSLAEKWSAQNDCTEFASDCELENTESLAFHLKMGFREASRNIHFIKKLNTVSDAEYKGIKSCNLNT